MRTFQLYKILGIVVLVVLLNACQQPGGESPGSEYMPDMAHSIAYEANYYNYYYNNTWGSEEDYHKYAMPRKPVEGTVPFSNPAHMTIPQNGASDYNYGDTEEERLRASNEIINNPHPITEAGLANGKKMYNLYCAICHGEKGDGNGYLARDGGAYPVQPAILTSDAFIAASNGQMYHAIVYGKNLMGSYADKISTDERWDVVHYIRSLQAKEKKLAYNQMENTLNGIDRPAGDMSKSMLGMKDEADHGDHGHGHHDADHGDDHGHDAHDGDHDHDHEEGHHDGDHDEKH